MEEWKDIEGYEGLYQVSNYGRVKNVRTNQILKIAHNQKGYQHVCLINNGKHTKKIHRLVAQAFIPNPNDFLQINHKDKNKDNNIHTNLEWCDCYYNINYSLAKKILQFDLKGNLIKEWNSLSEIERVLKYNASAICGCCRKNRKTAYGYMWKYKEKEMI